MQRRAGVVEAAEAVGRTIGSTLPKGALQFLARQRFAVASSTDADRRVWASLLTGPAGFITAVDAQMLRLAARPVAGDPLADNLAARPELGLLVLDPATRQRMRFNGRGAPTPDGVFLLIQQVYGNCPKYIQRRRLGRDAEGGPPSLPRVSTALDARQQDAVARADTFFIASFHPRGRGRRLASRRPSRVRARPRPGPPRVRRLSRQQHVQHAGQPARPPAGRPAVRRLRERRRAAAHRPRARRGRLLGRRRRSTRSARQPGRSPLRFVLVEPSPSNPPLVTRRRLAASQVQGRRRPARRRDRMMKTMACGDVVPGCDFEAERADGGGADRKVAAHAAEAHGVQRGHARAGGEGQGRHPDAISWSRMHVSGPVRRRTRGSPRAPRPETSPPSRRS